MFYVTRTTYTNEVINHLSEILNTDMPQLDMTIANSLV